VEVFGGWGTPEAITMLVREVSEAAGPGKTVTDMETKQSGTQGQRATLRRRKQQLHGGPNIEIAQKQEEGAGARFEPVLHAEGPRVDVLLRAYFDRYDLDGSGVITSPKDLEMLLTNIVFSLGLKGTVADVAARLRGVEVSEQCPWDMRKTRAWLDAQMSATAG